jgi:hypothetical protein
MRESELERRLAVYASERKNRMCKLYDYNTQVFFLISNERKGDEGYSADQCFLTTTLQQRQQQQQQQQQQWKENPPIH